jgi:hypothetical protein
MNCMTLKTVETCFATLLNVTLLLKPLNTLVWRNAESSVEQLIDYTCALRMLHCRNTRPLTGTG